MSNNTVIAIHNCQGTNGQRQVAIRTARLKNGHTGYEVLLVTWGKALAYTIAQTEKKAREEANNLWLRERY